MELVKFENTFATLEEANAYISEHYTSTDAYRVKWAALSDDDKKIELVRSTEALNNLKYSGRVKSVSQKLQFPRVANYMGMGGMLPALYVAQQYDNQLISSYGPTGDPDGALAITKACIENALAMSYLNEVVQDVRITNIQGLTSMKAGSVSKTYNRDNKATLNSDRDIFTDKIYSILVDWIISSTFGI
jgi:hypothetical protein